MRLTQKLGVRQSQSVMMSPQMQLALKVLSLNRLELEDLLHEKIEENPLLELDNSDPNASDASNEGDKAADGSPIETLVSGDGEAQPDADRALEMDASASLEKALEASDWPVDQNIDHSIEELDAVNLRDQGMRDDFPRDISDTQAITLQSYLAEQIREITAPNSIRDIALALTYWLDEDGYLRDDDAHILAALTISEDQLAQAKLVVQGCDPPGLAQANLHDCLRAQFERRDAFFDIEAQVLANLQTLSAIGIQEFSSKYDLDKDDVADVLRRIQSLEPKPGREFQISYQPVQAPDLRVFKMSDGWMAEINEEGLPKLLIRDTYWQELAKQQNSETLKKYISSNRQSANWLRRTINTRAVSLLRTAYAIIERQTDYFEKGQLYLRPMTIRELSVDLDLNEGTVSRIVANKIMETPFGVIAMKDLFSSSVGKNPNGDAFASGSVKARIEAWIHDEASHKPLSDQKLVEMLKAEGVDLARRTVTKYREALNIPSSTIRRQQSRLSVSSQSSN
jgi:RNA polymerase sigma-54 factor